MLTEEARSRLVSQLTAGSDQSVESEQLEDTKTNTEPTGNEVDSNLQTSATGESEDGGSEETKEQPDKPRKMVPLDEHIKERQRRKQYQSEIQTLTNKVAQMEGYIAASERKSKIDPYLASILGDDAETEQEPEDPRDVALKDLQTWKQQQEARESQNLLTNVIVACKKVIPEVDENFLTDQFILKRTPEQALTEWKRIHPNSAVVTTQPARPAPPPTVARAPAGRAQDTNKPTDWKSVGMAVNKRLAGTV